MDSSLSNTFSQKRKASDELNEEGTKQIQIDILTKSTNGALFSKFLPPNKDNEKYECPPHLMSKSEKSSTISKPNLKRRALDDIYAKEHPLPPRDTTFKPPEIINKSNIFSNSPTKPEQPSNTPPLKSNPKMFSASNCPLFPKSFLSPSNIESENKSATDSSTKNSSFTFGQTSSNIEP